MDPQGWRPIETAPMNGGRVLVWFSYTEEEARLALEEGRAEAARWDTFLGGWMFDHDAQAVGHQPTHWQPLPPSPIKET
jgi:hypothetical protein